MGGLFGGGGGGGKKPRGELPTGPKRTEAPTNVSNTIAPETTGPTTLAVDSTSAGMAPAQRRSGFLVTPTLLDETYSPTGRRETFG